MTTLTRQGIAALLIAHCAGMLDLVVLPVWVGTLIGWYGLDPLQAGLLATLFLGGQVTSSLVLAPRFGRLPARVVVTVGFSVAALAFLGAALTRDYAAMAALHLIGGFGAGGALGTTHGTMGRSANPHRLFAWAGLALGIFGIAMLGGGGRLVAIHGGPAMFTLFAAVMAVASIAAITAFPRPAPAAVSAMTIPPRPAGRLPSAAWFCIAGFSAVSLANAMVYSFVERIGVDRGFGVDAVVAVLTTVGFVNLLPPLLAAALERRLRAERVLIAAPVVIGSLALIITQSTHFAPYAAATAVQIGVVVFTHTFLFGLLARLDRSGRAVAATPAMLMIGSAIGPVLAGTLVKTAGYEALGAAVAAVCLVSLLCFLQLSRRPTAAAAPCAAVER